MKRPNLHYKTSKHTLNTAKTVLQLRRMIHYVSMNHLSGSVSISEFSSLFNHANSIYKGFSSIHYKEAGKIPLNTKPAVCFPIEVAA